MESSKIKEVPINFNNFQGGGLHLVEDGKHCQLMDINYKGGTGCERGGDFKHSDYLILVTILMTSSSLHDVRVWKLITRGPTDCMGRSCVSYGKHGIHSSSISSSK
ncbi:hypothetical protein MKX03_014883 [Papaver bracteatum]|nr:hypothetical protein MKX03_014883 [Papaver bracteatum]